MKKQFELSFISSAVIFFSLFYLFSCKPAQRKENTSGISDTSAVAEQSIDSSGSEVATEAFDSMVRQYEDPERKNWQSPELVLQKMGDLKNKTVADIGVGTGYFAFRIIQRGAHVIGIDIDKRFLDYINERKSDLPADVASRLETRLTVPQSPELNPDEVDWVLIVNTYHFLENRIDYLKKLYTALKPGGKIMIIDFKKGYTPVGPAESDKVMPQVAVSELKSAGFQLIDEDESSLQYQYIIRARKP